MLGVDLSLSGVVVRGGGGPSLSLDFVEGHYQAEGESAVSFVALDGVAFSRAGPGLAVTGAGEVIAFAADAPRITDKGLLLEEAATNLLVNSSLSGGSWYLAGPSRTTGQTDPMGGSSGTLLSFPASADAQCYCVQGLTAAPHTVSVFAKVASGTKAFRLAYYNGTDSVFSEDFVATTTWRRFAYGIVGTGASGEALSIVNATMGDAGEVIVALVQAELGNVPTSPIVTGGAPASRAGDVAAVSAPASTSVYAAVFGDAETVVTGAVTPGASFDLVAGRPWLNVGLKRLTMR